MLTSDQLQATILTAEEIGPRWEDYRSDWQVEEPGVPGGTRCGRLLLGEVDDGLVVAVVELLTHPTTTPAEAVEADMRRRPPPASAWPPGVHVGDAMVSVEMEPPFTPTEFGDDAVAVRATGVNIDDYPAATLLAVWNDGGVQAKVGTVNYAPPPLSGRLTFDGLRLAERQRDKLRIALSS